MCLYRLLATRGGSILSSEMHASTYFLIYFVALAESTPIKEDGSSDAGAGPSGLQRK